MSNMSCVPNSAKKKVITHLCLHIFQGNKRPANQVECTTYFQEKWAEDTFRITLLFYPIPLHRTVVCLERRDE